VGARATRYDQGHMRWTERDLAVLVWTFEQYVIRLDQLAELAGRWPGKETQVPGRLGEPTVRALVARWRQTGVVQSDTLLVRQPLWCWVTPNGQALLELEARPWDPTSRGVRTLAHRYYVNQVRLWVERTHPEAVWTSERVLLRGQPARAKGAPPLLVPDAEVQLAGRHIAIEVELTAKTEARWQELLVERAARYDQVWYFTPAHLSRDLGRAVEALEASARAKVSLSQVNEAAYRLGRSQP
jgi:hypothetical protein